LVVALVLADSAPLAAQDRFIAPSFSTVNNVKYSFGTRRVKIRVAPGRRANAHHGVG